MATGPFGEEFRKSLHVYLQSSVLWDLPSFPPAGSGSKNWLRPGNWALGKLTSDLWSRIFNLFWWNYAAMSLLAARLSSYKKTMSSQLSVYISMGQAPGGHSNLAIHYRDDFILLWQLRLHLLWLFWNPLISFATSRIQFYKTFLHYSKPQSTAPTENLKDGGAPSAVCFFSPCLVSVCEASWGHSHLRMGFPAVESRAMPSSWGLWIPFIHSLPWQVSTSSSARVYHGL